MIIKHFIIQLMHNIQYVDTIKIIKYLKVFQYPSSGSLVQCLAKNYRNDSIVSVDTDKSRCYGSVVRVCSSLYMKALIYSAFIYSELHTRTAGQNMLP